MGAAGARYDLPLWRAAISVGAMHGVRIFGVKFTEFLGPVLPELDRCFVYAAELSYPRALLLLDDEAEAREQARIDRELRALSVDSESRFYAGVFRPGFLGRLGCCVRDDWNDLILFAENPDWQALAERRRGMAPTACAWAGASAPVGVIQNWDGAFWQLYSEDGSLLAKLRAAHEVAGRQLLDVVWEHDQLDPVLEAVARRDEELKRRGGD